MSKTTPAEYHGFCFWVFDVCQSILFAEMAAVAGEAPAAERSAWLADLERQLRVHAIVGADFAIPLDQWCDGHEEQFLALVSEAGRRLDEACAARRHARPAGSFSTAPRSSGAARTPWTPV